MTRQNKHETPKRQWEQALIEAYCDYRYHQVLDPLYDQFQRWKAGELSHADIDKAIHLTHKKNQELYRLLTERRDYLVKLIRFDEEWFGEWVKDHPPPAGIQPVPQQVKSSKYTQEEQNDDTTL